MKEKTPLLVRDSLESEKYFNSMYKPAWLDLMVQPQQSNENPTASKRPSVADFSDKLEEIDR